MTTILPPVPVQAASERFGAAVGTFLTALDQSDPTVLWHTLRLDAALERRAQLDLRPLHAHLLQFALLVEATLTPAECERLQGLLGDPLWSDGQARVRHFAVGYRRERLRVSQRGVPWAWMEFDHLPPSVRELVLADALRRGVRVEV